MFNEAKKTLTHIPWDQISSKGESKTIKLVKKNLTEVMK